MSKIKVLESETIHVSLNEQFMLEAQIPTKVQVTVSQELHDKLIELDACEEDKFSVLCGIAGLNTKEDFTGTDLSGMPFIDEGTYLEGANFRATSLNNTFWRGTSLRGTLLEGADLTGAQGLSEEDIAAAYIDEQTKLPEQFSRVRIKALHDALDLPAPPPNRPDEERMIIFALDSTLHRKM